ncbi:hypothetical protein Nepgr_028500 [Nepenthes gracilis]|uniref:Uncharacterized protein n=1 Tax=Nepenthes gracilis TaxID=150966 RepID=A0AAD3TDU7_NEPGR|nr:hypothetical protein Nepgr_028500 [Nepenthes gracilis]
MDGLVKHGIVDGVNKGYRATTKSGNELRSACARKFASGSRSSGRISIFGVIGGDSSSQVKGVQGDGKGCKVGGMEGEYFQVVDCGLFVMESADKACDKDGEIKYIVMDFGNCSRMEALWDTAGRWF